MASIGYPVVGDLVYNTKQTGTEAARRKLGLIGSITHFSYGSGILSRVDR